MNNKKKIITGIILLLITLVVIKIFSGGLYLYNFWEELIPQILILLIVSIILMIVPLIFRIINKKRLEYKKGKKICLLNSIIIFIIFTIPNIITIINGEVKDTMSIDPIDFSKSLILVYFIISIIYYFINMNFFVKNKKRTN